MPPRKKAKRQIEELSADPIFRLSTVAAFAHMEPSKLLAWVNRSLVTVSTRNPGTGKLRRYSLREMLQIVLMSRMVGRYGISPSALSKLTQDLALTFVGTVAENHGDEILDILHRGTPEQLTGLIRREWVRGLFVWRGNLPSLKLVQAAAKKPGATEEDIINAIDEQCLLFETAEDMKTPLSEVAAQMDAESFMVIDFGALSKQVFGPALALWCQEMRE